LNWTGVGTALITPFVGEDIDYVALEKLLHWQIEEGVDALIVAGTTGESATLSAEEKLALFAFTVKVVKGRIPVIAGTGSNSTKDTIALSKEAEALGVDGLLLVTPYYNKPSQRGLYAHYKAVAEAVNLPVVLYNVPGRTSVDLLPETVVALSKVPNIVALKEASGHPERVEELLPLVGPDFRIYSGNDHEIAAFIKRGGHGVISVLSNIVPKGVHELTALGFSGDTLAMDKAQEDFLPLIETLFMDTNPVPCKEALRVMGFCDGSLRLPLVGLEESDKEKILGVLTDQGLL